MSVCHIVNKNHIDSALEHGSFCVCQISLSSYIFKAFSGFSHCRVSILGEPRPCRKLGPKQRRWQARQKLAQLPCPPPVWIRRSLTTVVSYEALLTYPERECPLSQSLSHMCPAPLPQSYITDRSHINRAYFLKVAGVPFPWNPLKEGTHWDSHDCLFLLQTPKTLPSAVPAYKPFA